MALRAPYLDLDVLNKLFKENIEVFTAHGKVWSI